MRLLPAAGADGHHGYAGGLLEHTVGVATLCRETAQLHPRLRTDLLARRRAAARRRPHARARSRAGVPPDGGRAPARSCPSRPAPDRGALRRPRRGGARGASPRGRRPPRPPGRAHRRGSGALPREPARRAGRDPARRGVATAIDSRRALALAAAALWGTGDFFGGLATRRVNVLIGSALVAAASASRGVVVWIARDRGAGRPGGDAPAYAARRAIAGASGSAASTAGMAVGAMGIVAPDLGDLADRAARGRPSLAATRRRRSSGSGSRSRSAGIVLVSREPGEDDGRGARRGCRAGTRCRARLRAVRRRPRRGGAGERPGASAPRASAPSRSSRLRSPGRAPRLDPCLPPAASADRSRSACSTRARTR